MLCEALGYSSQAFTHRKVCFWFWDARIDSIWKRHPCSTKGILLQFTTPILKASHELQVVLLTLGIINRKGDGVMHRQSFLEQSQIEQDKRCRWTCSKEFWLNCYDHEAGWFCQVPILYRAFKLQHCNMNLSDGQSLRTGEISFAPVLKTVLMILKVWTIWEWGHFVSKNNFLSGRWGDFFVLDGCIVKTWLKYDFSSGHGVRAKCLVQQ